MDSPGPRATVGPGSLLGGRYRLGRVLGRGGTATVHAATDEVLGREVAVKVLAPGLGTGAAREDEARLLAAVSHPHLVTLHDADLEGEPSYLVMELVAGPSLAGQLREHGALTATQVEALATQLGSALAHIHARGLVHRDLKPGNVLLAEPLDPDATPDARLTDFGIARLTDAARLTATGTVLGTAAYLSPEQARGGAVGPPSDVYGLGLVLLEAVTGQVAYPGPPMEAAAARLARQPVVPPELPERLRSLLSAATALDPTRRPTAAQVARLDPGSAAEATTLLPGEPDEPGEHTGPAATTALAPAGERTSLLAPPAGSRDGGTALLPAAPDDAPDDAVPDERGKRRRRPVGLLVGLVALVAALVLGVVLLARPGGGPALTPATTTSSTAPAATTTSAATPTSTTPATTATTARTPAGPGSGHAGPGGGKGGPPGKTKGKG